MSFDPFSLEFIEAISKALEEEGITKEMITSPFDPSYVKGRSESIKMEKALINLKQFTEPIHDYHLHFWGGIENDGLATSLLGTEERNFWFPTPEERLLAQNALKALAEQYKQVIVFMANDGPLSRKRTVAIMEMIYQGVKYPYEYDFGFGYPSESAHYMFFDGNYSCDCNKSLFLQNEGFDIPELECGKTILIRMFRIIYKEKGE